MVTLCCWLFCERACSYYQCDSIWENKVQKKAMF